MTTTLNRRLSARRGSTTAPDPFGVHAEVNLNPNRSSSSTLTIVRVPVATTAAPVPPSLNDPPSSPVLNPRRLHRRLARDAPGAPAPVDQSTTRMSFAFSSFGPASGQRSSSPSNSHPPSPSSSPRLRPSSPHFGPGFPSSGKPRLTPDQLVELARQATNPRPPLPCPSDQTAETTPATFTPLPDDIFLPFIDRAAEVATLISSPPDVKLFSLLAQTFSTTGAAKLHQGVNPAPAAGASAGALTLSSVPSQPDQLPRDPAQWTYAQLVYHLTKIDRDLAPDFIWTIAARKCILSHSELLWERIKGALGVPPELDVEYDFLDDDEESPDTSDISDDEGRAAKGHWSDWDEVMDSPMYARNPKRLSMESPNASIYMSSSRRESQIQSHDHAARFGAQIEDRLQGLQELGGGYTSGASRATPSTGEIGDENTASGVNSTGEVTIAPTPHALRSPPVELDQGGIVHGTFSPEFGSTEDRDSSEYLSIEPMIAPSTSFGATGSGSDGLGDIAEGAEEEEEGTTDVTATTTTTGGHLSPSSREEGMISPSQIQGLRISTSPLPAGTPVALAANTPPVHSPVSPLPPYPSSASASNTGTTGAQPQPIPSSSRTHSRASSFSSIGPFQRSESTGNLSASWIAMAAAVGGSGGAGSVFGSEAGDSAGYMSDGPGDRGMGNVLFPSNFARLAGGLRGARPTPTVPHARYQAGGKTRTKSHGSTGAPGVSPAGNRQSWGAGSVPTTSSTSTSNVAGGA